VSVASITAWYDNWHREHGVNSWRPREAYQGLVDLVHGYKSVLDVGCGTGTFLSLLPPYVDAFGVDISFQAVMLAWENAPNAGVKPDRGEDIGFKSDSFDCVTAWGSLEHFTDIDAGLSEMRRVVKPHGRVFIMVPNKWFIGWFLIGRGTKQQEINEHLDTLWGWKKRFERAGFRVKRILQDPWKKYPVPKFLAYQLVYELEPVK
jgi:ubiquinone/menaquinone biosynthesis C-methylase UbiE